MGFVVLTLKTERAVGTPDAKERCIVSPLGIVAGGGEVNHYSWMQEEGGNNVFPLQPPLATAGIARGRQDAPYVPTPVSTKTLFWLSDRGYFRRRPFRKAQWTAKLTGNFYALCRRDDDVGLSRMESCIPSMWA